MNIYSTVLRRESHVQSIAMLLILSTLAWTLGFSVFVKQASAATVEKLESRWAEGYPSIQSNYQLTWQHQSATFASGDTITINFHANFDTSAIVLGDIDLVLASGTGMFPITNIPLTTAANGSTTAWIVSGLGTDSITLKASSTSRKPYANEHIRVIIGDNATFEGNGSNQITTPTAGNYRSYLTSEDDYGEWTDAFVANVAVTATVSSTLTFTVAAVNAGVALGNGVSTNATSTATTMAFGSLVAASQQTMGHTLTVSTNANHGFTVYARTIDTGTGNPKALVSTGNNGANDDANAYDSGAVIDWFVDGSATATTTAWAAPTGAIADASTWGHFGITSGDTDLDDVNNGAGRGLYDGSGASYLDFRNSKFSGRLNDIAPGAAVFAHGGPTDGTASGTTKVGVRVEITALQEAANDYSTTLVYTIVPTF